jgi:hypothetical protein
MLGEDAADDILIEFDAKCMSDLLGDAHAAEARVAPLELDDGGDEFKRRALGARLAARRGGAGEEPAILLLQKSPVLAVYQEGKLTGSLSTASWTTSLTTFRVFGFVRDGR